MKGKGSIDKMCLTMLLDAFFFQHPASSIQHPASSIQKTFTKDHYHEMANHQFIFAIHF